MHDLAALKFLENVLVYAICSRLFFSNFVKFFQDNSIIKNCFKRVMVVNGRCMWNECVIQDQSNLNSIFFFFFKSLSGYKNGWNKIY